MLLSVCLAIVEKNLSEWHFEKITITVGKSLTTKYPFGSKQMVKIVHGIPWHLHTIQKPVLLKTW